MKFIGHLDIMRYFQKAFRRSETDVEYSQGFSPHQLISFAAPLGVGLTSDSEYLDIQVKTSGTSEEMIKQLNEVMTEGISIISFKELTVECKNAMSIVAGADYLVSLKDGYVLKDGIIHNVSDVFQHESTPVEQVFPEFREKFNEFYNRETITILKKTKKSQREMDIKPFIYHMSLDKNDFMKQIGNIDSKDSVAEVYENGNCVFLQLATGSVTNLKPELVMEAFCNYLGVTWNEYAFQTHRLEVYADMGTEEERKLVSLEELGREI